MTNDISQGNFLRDTIKLKVDTEAAFLELAARLHKIHTEDIWKSEYDSYNMFLMDARISKATASKLESVYFVFVLKHQIPSNKLAEVGWSSLYSIASRADTKEKAEELVDRAKLLTREHLAQSLKNEHGQQDMCVHAKTHDIRICNDCGFRVPIV